MATAMPLWLCLLPYTMLVAGGFIQVWDSGSPANAEPVSTSTAAVEGAATEPDGAAVGSTGNAAAQAVPGSSHVTAAAAAPADPTSAEDDDSLTDEELAARAAAAAAAAQAAAEAAAAEAAAAAAAEAAAQAMPKPVAPGIKPRLFVVDPASGSGYEVLASEAVEQWVAAVRSQPGQQHLQQQALGAEEPGTTCHTFLSSYAPSSSSLQPLQVAQPKQVLSLPVNPDQDLVSLRRVHTVVQPEWQAGQGLKLPRIAALNPWDQASAGAAAWEGGAVLNGQGSSEPAVSTGLAATRLPDAGPCGSASQPAGVCGPPGQVVVVREVLELPELGPDVQEKVAAAVAAWETLR